MLHRLPAILRSEIKNGEGHREASHDDGVHPTKSWEPDEDQAPQHNEGTQNRPDDLHLNHDLDPLPGCLLVRKP